MLSFRFSHSLTLCVITKNTQVIYISTAITKCGLQKMCEEVQLKGYIYEQKVNFRYTSKMKIYANLSLDISKLYAIARKNKEVFDEQNIGSRK